MFLGVLTLLVVDYMQLKIPEIYKDVVDGITDGVIEKNKQFIPFDMDYLLDKVCLPMMITILILVFGRFLWRICFRGSAIKMETDLRGKMFDKCKDLSQEYYQVNKVGNLMALFTNDLETVQECFGWGVLMFFDATMLCTMALFKMFRMEKILALLSLVPMVFLIMISVVMKKQLKKRWGARQAAFSSLSDFSQETFSGIAVVKAFVKETIMLSSFGKLNKQNEETNVSHTKLATLLSVLVTLFAESVVCVILGYGGYLVWCEKFDAASLVEFIGYFTSMVWPVMAVSQLIEMRSRGIASLERIGTLLEAEPDVKDKENVITPPSISGDIEFKNLTFRHPFSENDAIKNVSFKINKGEHVGIIGKTGSGKTTLVDLILRTYNVPENTLFIGGYDVNSVPIKVLRDHIAYVPQDNFLFSDTIESNIAFSGDIEREKIVEASKLADIHHNIEGFTKGYETVLGERGVTVSGGQKQRISIARAFVKDAEILILDDSVSAVDVKTEKTILENLRKSRKGKTTILIAHRVSTIDTMDKIIYINQGKIEAVGTHKELMERCPLYKNTVELQRLSAEEEENGK